MSTPHTETPSRTREDESRFISSYVRGEKFTWSGNLSPDGVDELLYWAKSRNASDITIQSNECVWAQFGGKLFRITERPLTNGEIEAFVRTAYGENGPGLVRSGRDLDPSYDTRMEGGIERYRLNITGGRIPGGTGFQLTFRALPKTPPSIVEIPHIEQDIIDNLRPEQGLILVTGPTGSGKSTLLYAGMRYLMEDPERYEKVLDYSKPIEYTMDGLNFPNSFIFQTEPGRHLKNPDCATEAGQWQYSVRNSLRRKPEIILVGESRDRATFEGCLEATQTGHLTFSTMHTMGVPETIRRALKFFSPEERRGAAIDMLDALTMVVTQRLIPRCDGKGKVAIREYLVFDGTVYEELVDLDPDFWPSRIRAMMSAPIEERKVKAQSLKEAAGKLLERGIIDKKTFNGVAARQRNEAVRVGQATRAA